ncbi:MAG: hypothetical protein ABL874_07085 [Sphingopyxis sp.]
MLEHGDRVGSQGEAQMAADGFEPDFSSRLIAAFEKHVQLPLMAQAGAFPTEVSGLIETFRNRLALLEQLVPGQPLARASVPANGSHAPEPAMSFVNESDDIGRNQRSRVRELMLLEALEAEHHALSLPQLTRALTESGFDDTSAAIVSQLHRLKKLGVIAQPANGMYVLTQDGVLHVRELRRNFGHLKPR